MSFWILARKVGTKENGIFTNCKFREIKQRITSEASFVCVDQDGG